MKHASKICKICGSRNPGVIFDRELLDDEDFNRIRICGICKSEYFHMPPEPVENFNEAHRLIDDSFVQASKALGISQEQALLVAKQLFVKHLKV